MCKNNVTQRTTSDDPYRWGDKPSPWRWGSPRAADDRHHLGGMSVLESKAALGPWCRLSSREQTPVKAEDGARIYVEKWVCGGAAGAHSKASPGRKFWNLHGNWGKTQQILKLFFQEFLPGSGTKMCSGRGPQYLSSSECYCSTVLKHRYK